ESARNVDLGDLGAALLSEPALGPLVALGVGGMPERVHRRLEQRPAQVGGPVLGQWAASIPLSGLVHARTKTRVAGELLWRWEALDLADLGGDREGEDPADPGHRQEQRDVGVLGVALLQAAVD